MKCLSFALLAASQGVQAMPAILTTFSTPQPDGHPSGCLGQLIGNPGYHYVICQAVPEGFYSAVVNQGDQVLYYGEMNAEGEIVASDIAIGSIGPDDEGFQDIPMNLIESYHVADKKCQENDYCRWKKENNGASDEETPNDSYSNLVIPFIFVDHVDRTPMKLAEIEEDIFNDNDISVKDFFESQSYQKLSWSNTFAATVTITKTELECADNTSGTSNKIKECLAEVLAGVQDFFPSDFDGVTFLHSGYGAEFGGRDQYQTFLDDRIWSHSWEIDAGEIYKGRYALVSAWYGYTMDRYMRVGSAIHEIAQMMGAPTLYGPEPGNGLGYYDPLSNPYGFDGNLHHPGALSAYTKVLLEFADVVEITESGLVEVEPSDISSKVYKISQGFPTEDEYLLIEYRRAKGYDKGLRGPGLAIYHIDGTANGIPGYNGDGSYPKNHYRVSLIQADGRFDLETEEDNGDTGDLFYTNGAADGITPDGPLVNGVAIPAKFPNTKAYALGKFSNSGVTIKDIAATGDTMKFYVAFDEVASSS